MKTPYRYYRDYQTDEEVCEKHNGLGWIEVKRTPLDKVRGTSRLIRNVKPYAWAEFSAYCEMYGLTQSEAFTQIMDIAIGVRIQGELAIGGSQDLEMAGSRRLTTPPEYYYGKAPGEATDETF